MANWSTKNPLHFTLRWTDKPEQMTHADMLFYVKKAIASLTRGGDYPLTDVALYVSEDPDELGDHHFMETRGHGEPMRDPRDKKPIAIAKTDCKLVDIGDIPGHPPIYIPGAPVPVVTHLMHDVSECDWCAKHPMNAKPREQLMDEPPKKPSRKARSGSYTLTGSFITNTNS